jgi:hypothetical protein
MFLVSACTGSGGNAPNDTGTALHTGETGCHDDCDGYDSLEDCDDTDPNINPGATEECNGVDDDCDGEIDEDVTTTFYVDGDEDGYGDDEDTVEACESPTGHVEVGGDCDDEDASLNPDDADDDGTSTCDGDCDDEDPDSTIAGEDADCDGTLTEDDCDDEDPDSTVVAEDPDCNGRIDCSDILGSLGAPTEVASNSGGGGYGIGAWMSDAGPEGSEKVWVMMDYDGDQVLEYDTRSDLESDSAYRTISLDEDWAGTGHVVLDGVLYYNEEDSQTLVALDLDSETELVRADLPDAGTTNTYPYSYYANTDIDLSVDGTGLYATYSTEAADGKLVVSELDPATLEVMETWTADSALKLDFTNTFLACGVLYGVDSEEDGGPCFYCTDMSIDLAWDLSTGEVSDPAIDFTSPGESGYTGSVDYNPVDGMIYVMRGGTMGLIEPNWE